MAIKTLFVDPSRCIGCRACEAACRECDSHKGESMVMVDFIDRTWSVATQPTVCMHCADPVAPCAQVCPVLAILITPDGVVQQADPSRCIACRNCVYACPFGVPKIDVEARLMALPERRALFIGDSEVLGWHRPKSIPPTGSGTSWSWVTGARGRPA